MIAPATVPHDFLVDASRVALLVHNQRIGQQVVVESGFLSAEAVLADHEIVLPVGLGAAGPHYLLLLSDYVDPFFRQRVASVIVLAIVKINSPVLVKFQVGNVDWAAIVNT